MSFSTSSAPARDSNPPARQDGGGPPLIIAGRPFFYASGVLPDDFVERLVRLKQATGLTWTGFADALGVDRKQALRWKEDGTEPCGGAILSLVRLAAVVPGGLDMIMGEGFLASSMSCSTSSAPARGGNPPARQDGGGPPLIAAGRPFFYASGVLPDDFVERLERLKQATGLTWTGFADALGVDRKQALRWKEDGTEPCGGAMLSLLRLAGVVPGGLDMIMGEGFLASLWRP